MGEFELVKGAVESSQLTLEPQFPVVLLWLQYLAALYNLGLPDLNNNYLLCCQSQKEWALVELESLGIKFAQGSLH